MTIDDLDQLSPMIHDAMVRTITSLAEQAQADGRSINVGLNRGAIIRAGVYFKQRISSDEHHIDSGAAEAFAHAWALGEAAALRRAAMAITSAKANGREVDVVAALLRGASIDEALREPAHTNVVKFPGGPS